MHCRRGNRPRAPPYGLRPAQMLLGAPVRQPAPRTAASRSEPTLKLSKIIAFTLPAAPLRPRPPRAAATDTDTRRPSAARRELGCELRRRCNGRFDQRCVEGDRCSPRQPRTRRPPPLIAARTRDQRSTPRSPSPPWPSRSRRYETWAAGSSPWRASSPSSTRATTRRPRGRSSIFSRSSPRPTTGRPQRRSTASPAPRLRPRSS